MSLNQLLSFVPFVRQPGSDSERASSGTFMVFFSLNLLGVVWWLMLLVSAVALFVFALLRPGVAFFNTSDARDAEIASINSLNGVDVLQRKAVYDVSQGSASSATATYLCHVAVETFFFM